MKVDGQCHCGEIRYEAQVDASNVGICHCNDCQILTGSAYRVSVPVSAANLKFLKGAPKIYVKTAESGNKRAQGFCADCGSPIYATDAHKPEIYFLRVGTLSQRAALPPKRQIWCDAQLPWAADIRALERRERA
jgi:hypothetical protein